jgi:hypothetical protein
MNRARREAAELSLDAGVFVRDGFQRLVVTPKFATPV